MHIRCKFIRRYLFGKKGKETIRASEGTIRAGYGSKRSLLKKIWFRRILEQTLRYKRIIKMNQDSMAFILEII